MKLQLFHDNDLKATLTFDDSGVLRSFETDDPNEKEMLEGDIGKEDDWEGYFYLAQRPVGCGSSVRLIEGQWPTSQPVAG